MPRRIHANGKEAVSARYRITGGGDTNKNIIVAAVFNAETGSLEAREFRQHREDALHAAAWFQSHQVGKVIIESTANYHLLYYDTLREAGIDIAVINPIVVKSLLRVEGKSDKGDAMTLARLAASFDLKTSNMPDNQQRELRLLFKRVDAWKTHRTQITNRTNGTLTGLGFTVFRLVAINSPAGLHILHAIIQGRSPQEIAALHRTKAKRPEIEKCAAVQLTEYIRDYLQEVLDDVTELNRRLRQGETDLLEKIDTYRLNHTVELMCTVPGVTRMLALRIIAEMADNYHQRYYSAAAFAKAIGVVASNEVSGGKLLKRRASHGNARVKFHFLSAAKAYAIYGHTHLHSWYVGYRARSNYMKAISAMARRMAEGLWWVLVRQEAFKDWNGEPAREGREALSPLQLAADPDTGELLDPMTDLNC